jgi:thiol-disulfide isomerase/thioredoxin
MRSVLAGLVAAALLFAGCSAAVGDPSGERDTTAEPWRTAALRDVVTGEEFSIEELKGKVVAIETMAIWCVTCRIQQLEAQTALETLGSSDVAYVSLAIDPNERAEDLAEYARREGFDWRFAIASPEVSRSLVATFGDQILSPPSTPLVILDPQGQVVEQHIGITGARALVALFQEHLP